MWTLRASDDMFAEGWKREEHGMKKVLQTNALFAGEDPGDDSGHAWVL